MSRMKRKYRSQTRIPGVHRMPMSTALLKELEAWVQDEMRMWKVSRSFVLANCVSFASGIKSEDYRKPRILKKRA